MKSNNSWLQKVAAAFTSVWRWLRWGLLLLLTFVFILELVAIVDTPVWKVIEVLVVPASLGFGIWWLDRRETERDRAKEIENQRKAIELDYQLALAEVAAEYPREISKAAAKLDASRVVYFQRAENDKKRLIEKRRELQLAQLEEDEKA